MFTMMSNVVESSIIRVLSYCK